MAMATAASSSASPANPKILLGALLCAAVASSLLPLSSAGVSVLSLTCRRTAHERLCISILDSHHRSDAAESVQELAAVALLVSRNSTLGALRRAMVLGSRAPTPLERGLLAQCQALYSECLRETTRAIASVTAASYGDAARASAALRGYPDRCESLFAARGIRSSLQQTDRKLQEELLASAEIVGLLP